MFSTFARKRCARYCAHRHSLWRIGHGVINESVSSAYRVQPTWAQSTEKISPSRGLGKRRPQICDFLPNYPNSKEEIQVLLKCKSGKTLLSSSTVGPQETCLAMPSIAAYYVFNWEYHRYVTGSLGCYKFLKESTKYLGTINSIRT